MVTGGLETDVFGGASEAAFYDPAASILGNEILAQILASLLRQLATFQFQLDLDNASFLDVR